MTTHPKSLAQEARRAGAAQTLDILRAAPQRALVVPKPASFIPPIDDSVQRECKALFIGGYSVEDVVRDVGINMNTMRDWVKKGKWIMEREMLEKVRLKRQPTEEMPVAKMLLARRTEFRETFEAKTHKIAAEDATHWADNMQPEDRLENAQGIAALGKFHRATTGLDKDEHEDGRHISLTFLGSPDSVRLLTPVEPKQLEDAG